MTFEGIEGSGKSTHARRLAARLRAAGHTVTETREPGGTPAGVALRRLLLGADAVPLTPWAEVFLYCADRSQHVADVIRPALAAGHVVVSDRFSESTIAYQGYGRGLDLATVRMLDAQARDGTAPGLTFVLDCPVADGLARAHARSGARPPDRFEREEVAFHERVRAGFRALAAAEPDRFRVLDGTRALDALEDEIVAETERRLGTRR